MTENIKKKSYLLMIEESIVPFMHSIMPHIQFVEVEAINMKDNTDHVLLGNPVPKPAAIEAPPEALVEDNVTPILEEAVNAN